MCAEIEMYPAVHAKNGQLKHSSQCQMTFGRKDPKCHRCVELMNGSTPREGWQKSYFKHKKIQEEIEINAIRNHDCKKSGCGPVCTFGDW